LNFVLFVGALLAGAAASVAAQEHTSAATIEVVGGPHAGKHTLVVRNVGCTLSELPKGIKRFNSNFGKDSKDPKALTFVLVSIRNANGPGAPSHADFDASVTFGPVMDKRLETYYMSGSNPTTGRQGGTGTVILKAGDKDAQVTLELQPQPGVSVKGTVTCTLIRY
jgi:hypothetical protein